eukprot:2804114-Rhodomonas_salina.1
MQAMLLPAYFKAREDGPSWGFGYGPTCYRPMRAPVLTWRYWSGVGCYTAGTSGLVLRRRMGCTSDDAEEEEEDDSEAGEVRGSEI